MKDWTTNPPPKLSIANSPDSFNTVGRDRSKREGARGAVSSGAASTSRDRVHATAAPPSATGTNTRKKR